MNIKTFLSNMRKLFFSKETIKQRRINNFVKNGLKLGKGTFFASWVNIDIPSLVEIGNNCVFADDVSILNHDASTMIHLNFGEEMKVVISDNCFIGCRTTILPGVIIGKNSIVGAGSVVSKDIPPFSVAAGNPAKVLMSLDEFISKRKKKVSKFLGLDVTDWDNVLNLVIKRGHTDSYTYRKFYVGNRMKFGDVYKNEEDNL